MRRIVARVSWVLVGLLLGCTFVVSAQQGPGTLFSANAFLQQAHTWTGVQTFTGGAIFNPCPGDGTTVIKQVATNDLGIYTGATACVGGTLRFDVSATNSVIQVPLRVNGTILTTAPPIVNSTSAGGFGFTNGNTGFFSFGANAATAGAFTFQNLSSDASVNITAITILPSGFMGIGNSAQTPAALLSVGGNGSASYTADITGSIHASTTITGNTFVSAGAGMAVANVGANSCGTTAATIAGNNNAFVVTTGTVGSTQCRVAFTVTAANEWDCSMTGDSAALVTPHVVVVDTTHTDFFATLGAGATFTGICFPR